MSDSSQRLSFREKFSYGLGDTASNFFFQTFNIFLLYYYTDVFGISAATAGTLFLVTRLWDTVNDPMMGVIADRTQTRWGKFRPYLLWMCVPYGIIGYLLFANPELSTGGKIIYAYVTYILMMMAYTAINIPYSAMTGVISSSSDERTSVSSYRFVCAFAGGLLISMLVRPLVNALGGGDESLGFKLTMAIFAVLSIALFLVTFWNTRERVQPPVKQKSNLGADIRALWDNRPWIILFVVAIFTLANVATRNGATVYYFKYFVGDDGSPYWWIFDQTTIVMTMGMLGLIVGVLFAKPLSARMEKKTIMVVFTTLNALAIGGFFLIPPDQFVLMVIVSFVGSVFAGPSVPLVWSMYADTADYGEWKSGRRSTGLVFSAALFAQKLGLTIGGSLAGWILGLFGFIANQGQTESALLGIRLLFTVFPAVLAVLSVVAIAFYPLGRRELETMERELAQRKEGKEELEEALV